MSTYSITYLWPTILQGTGACFIPFIQNWGLFKIEVLNLHCLEQKLVQELFLAKKVAKVQSLSQRKLGFVDAQVLCIFLN